VRKYLREEPRNGTAKATGSSLVRQVLSLIHDANAKASTDLEGLDGGGVRGLATVMIIEDIMRGINEGREASDQLRPWQVFDLIGGTSTGG